ncbi:hypothetical protein M885DRAFT_418891, partial [Pelagophyceae sp. CCMP2097]
ARSAGGVGAFHLTAAPVIILPLLDHSPFCPGFRVPGDIFPAECDAETALAAIGETVAAFLDHGAAGALEILAARSRRTRYLLLPLASALRLERNGDEAPWCAVAQRKLGADDERLKVRAAASATAGEWRHTRVAFARGADVFVNVSGHAVNYGVADVESSCVNAAQE